MRATLVVVPERGSSSYTMLAQARDDLRRARPRWRSRRITRWASIVGTRHLLWSEYSSGCRQLQRRLSRKHDQQPGRPEGRPVADHQPEAPTLARSPRLLPEAAYHSAPATSRPTTVPSRTAPGRMMVFAELGETTRPPACARWGGEPRSPLRARQATSLRHRSIARQPGAWRSWARDWSWPSGPQRARTSPGISFIVRKDHHQCAEEHRTSPACAGARSDLAG